MKAINIVSSFCFVVVWILFYGQYWKNFKEESNHDKDFRHFCSCSLHVCVCVRVCVCVCAITHNCFMDNRCNETGDNYVAEK